MITSGKEKERAQRLRLIARQYCDGEYNKIEYRRRRRELLEQCVARDHEPAARPEEPVAPEQRRSRSMASTTCAPRALRWPSSRFGHPSKGAATPATFQTLQNLITPSVD